MADHDIQSLMTSSVDLHKEEKDTRTLEELTPLVEELRVKLGGGETASLEDIRTIVSYFRLYRRTASKQARSNAKGKRKVTPKLTKAEELNFLESL